MFSCERRGRSLLHRWRPEPWTRAPLRAAVVLGRVDLARLGVDGPELLGPGGHGELGRRVAVQLDEPGLEAALGMAVRDDPDGADRVPFAVLVQDAGLGVVRVDDPAVLLQERRSARRDGPVVRFATTGLGGRRRRLGRLGGVAVVGPTAGGEGQGKGGSGHEGREATLDAEHVVSLGGFSVDRLVTVITIVSQNYDSVNAYNVKRKLLPYGWAHGNSSL